MILAPTRGATLSPGHGATLLEAAMLSIEKRGSDTPPDLSGGFLVRPGDLLRVEARQQSSGLLSPSVSRSLPNVGSRMPGGPSRSTWHGTIRRMPQPSPLQSGRAIHPRLKRLSFTHILQIDFVKEPGKTIAIVEIDIISALAIPLSSDFPKMWVRISLKRAGLSGSSL